MAFCISATENWTRQGTPQWVFDEGAKYYEVNGFLEVDYDDPVYLKAVDHFVEKMAERYDGDPNVAQVFERADQNMYDDKSSLKARKSRENGTGQQ